jgi:hypothetical protein
MSTGHTVPGQTVDVFKADIDMSSAKAFQFTAVGIGPAKNSDGLSMGDASLTRVTDATPYLGVLQNNPAQGANGVVMINGFTKILLAESVIVGDALVFNRDGAFVKAFASQAPVAIASEAAESGGLGTAYIVPSALNIDASVGGGATSSFRVLTGDTDPDASTGGNPGDLFINRAAATLFGPAIAGEDPNTTSASNGDNN